MTQDPTHAERLAEADPPFWCDTCGGTHPLSQHRDCRKATTKAVLAEIRKELSAAPRDGTR